MEWAVIVAPAVLVIALGSVVYAGNSPIPQ